jgi:hypothetical protein
MRWLLLCAFAVGCSTPGPDRPRTGGFGGTPDPGGAGGTGGSGGVTSSGGSGGAPADAMPAPAPDSATPDGPAARDAGGDTPSIVATGQGPVAEGRIAFSQDFEANMDGITRSPTNLPADRASIADDPLGQRGKVLKIVYLQGDNFQTNGGSTHTRSFISNTGYSFPVGTTIQYAWGFMTTSQKIDAAFAQVIRPGGPMWLIEGNGDGTTYVNCRSCGGKANLPVTLEPNKWYDFRVEMSYTNGGPITFYVNGAKVLERRLTANDGGGTQAHWDGGLYNHAAGTYTRTVYISNLSVATK